MSSDYYKIIKKRVRIKEIFQGPTYEISRGWKALSPFTKETDPSFKVTITPEGDRWTCFSSKNNGDVFDFYSSYNHVNEKTAFYELAKLAGLDTGDYELDLLKRDELSLFESMLVKEHPFLTDKGISREILDKYGAGYVEDISKLNLPPEIILKYELSNIRDSIVYLIKDGSKVNVGYYARPLSGSQNKYIGISPTQVYGIHQLSNETDYAIAVEGHNDVLKLRTEGIPNVLGLCGTNFHQEIFKTLKAHGISKLFIIPDGDQGGYNLITTIIQKYGKFDTYGVNVEYLILPEGFDPDDYVMKDKEFFTNPYKNSFNPILEFYRSKNGNPIDRINSIINEKPHLRRHEIQLALKEELGGIIDINQFNNCFYDPKAERIVISNILNDRMLGDKAFLNLSKDYFTDPENKRIIDFFLSHENVNVKTIENEFKKTFDFIDPIAHDLYVKRLYDIHDKKKMFDVLQKHSLMVVADQTKEDAIASSLVHELTEIQKKENTSVTAGHALTQCLDDINNNKMDGISIKDKFPQLNIVTRGMCQERLWIISGPTGTGKTSMACNIVDSVSVLQNHKTMFYTGEMSAEEMVLRQLSINTGINTEDILNRKATLSNDTLRSVADAPIVYGELPEATEAYQTLERDFLEHGFEMFVWDYAQLTPYSGRKKKHEWLGELTKSLKRFCKKYNIPGIVVSQLNRGAGSKKISDMSDLGGSYDMAADADVGITLNLPENQGDLSNGNLIINLDKMRYSKSKTLFPAMYYGECQRMNEL